jgi:hypothetical protein
VIIAWLRTGVNTIQFIAAVDPAGEASLRLILGLAVLFVGVVCSLSLTFEGALAASVGLPTVALQAEAAYVPCLPERKSAYRDGQPNGMAFPGSPSNINCAQPVGRTSERRGLLSL